MNHPARLTASILALGLVALPCAAQSPLRAGPPIGPATCAAGLSIAVPGPEAPLVEALVASAGVKASVIGEPSVETPLGALERAEIDLVVVPAELAGADAVVFARQPIGVYVHESNPITRLTVAQVAAILDGELTRWSQVGGPDRPLTLVTWTDGSHEPWLREHLGTAAAGAHPSVPVSSASALTATIARHPDALGFGPVDFTPGVRLLRVTPAAGEQAFWPCHDSVGDGRYPLTRELAFQLGGAPSAATRGLVAHALSSDGADTLRHAGVCPASDACREQGLQRLARLTSPPVPSSPSVPFGPRAVPAPLPADVLVQGLARDAARLTADAHLLSNAYAQARLARYLEPQATAIADER